MKAEKRKKILSVMLCCAILCAAASTAIGSNYVVQAYSQPKSSDNASQDASKTEHNWGSPEFVWSDDNTSANAVFTCLDDPSHTETVPAEVTSEYNEQTHSTYYTAVVKFNGQEYSEGMVIYDNPTDSQPESSDESSKNVSEESTDNSSKNTGTSTTKPVVTEQQTVTVTQNTSGSASPTNSTSGELPVTGDNGFTTCAALAVLISSAAIIAAYTGKKRKNYNK